MKAFLNSARIAPKKANVIAKMIRGMPVPEALNALAHTSKKAARLIEALLKSAVANATHNDKQKEGDLVVKTIVVNQGQGYRRGVPMARGRTRPMRKFLSHIEIILGISQDEEGQEKSTKKQKNEQKPSQRAEKTVKRSASKKPGKKTSPSSSDSSSSS